MVHEGSIAAAIRLYASVQSIAPSTASRCVTGNGDTLARIEAGGSLTTRRARAITAKLSALWPADLPWPANIPRRPPVCDSQPESQIADPVAAAGAAFARVVDATSAAEREAAAAEALAIGARLDPATGQIACPAALCAALGFPRFVYDDVVRRYAGKAPTRPRPGSRPARLLAALQHAGDRRFTPEAA